MSKDKREGWLAALKVGDVVVLDQRLNARPVEVTKITPTGRIKCGAMEFNPKGGRMGPCGGWLSPMAPDRVSELARKDARDLAASIDLRIRLRKPSDAAVAEALPLLRQALALLDGGPDV